MFQFRPWLYLVFSGNSNNKVLFWWRFPALAWTVGSSSASHWSAVAEVEILKWAVRSAERQNSFQKALRHHHTFHPHCKVVRLISHVCSVAYLMCGMYWSCQEFLFLKIVCKLGFSKLDCEQLQYGMDFWRRGKLSLSALWWRWGRLAQTTHMPSPGSVQELSILQPT